MELQYSYLDQYKIIKTLGSGYHAKVKLAQCPNLKLVAIKKFKKQTSDLQTLKHQLNVISKLHHQNLVNLIDVRPNAIYKKKGGSIYTCFAIVIQYAGGGELFDFIALAGRFSPNITRTYFCQMIEGIAYMHSTGYAHRDIKPQNILLTQNFVLKIADFGFSTLLEGKDKSGILHTRLGTQGYMAPQIQNRNYLGTQADIFSCGVILFIMYTASPPFQKSIPSDPKYKLIKQQKYEEFWQYHQRRKPQGFFTQQFKDLFQKMVEYDNKKRITLQGIKNHPWLKGPKLDINDLKKEFSLRKQKVDQLLKKQKQQKQLMKQSQTINNSIQILIQQQQQQNSEISNFIQNYHNKIKMIQQLPIKSQLQKGDLIINVNIDNFFKLFEQYFDNDKQIHLYKDQQNEIILKSKYEIKQNKLNLILQQEQQQCQKVVMEIQLTKTIMENNYYVCLSFRRICGNLLYYKKIINYIKARFYHISHW